MIRGRVKDKHARARRLTLRDAWINPRFVSVADAAGRWLRVTLRRLDPSVRSPRWPALTPVARHVERVVHLLDSAVPIPGTRVRVGIDPLLGLVFPAVGDAVGGVVSLGMLFLAVQYRVPAPIIARMVWNAGVDAAVGGIPVLGDVFDFAWKANDKNFELMMLHRGDVQKRASVGYWVSVFGLVVVGVVAVAAPIALTVWVVAMLVEG